MGEHVFAFVIDGELIGLTERQYGERLARQAKIETKAYIAAHPTLRGYSKMPRQGEIEEPHWQIIDVLRAHGGFMLPREIAAATGFTSKQCGHRLRVCCQLGYVLKSRVRGVKARYEAAPIDE